MSLSLVLQDNLTTKLTHVKSEARKIIDAAVKSVNDRTITFRSFRELYEKRENFFKFLESSMDYDQERIEVLKKNFATIDSRCNHYQDVKSVVAYMENYLKDAKLEKGESKDFINLFYSRSKQNYEILIYLSVLTSRTI